MRKFCFAFLAIFVFVSGYAQVKINELMYDPSGSDAGQEWVELYNCADFPIDLTGWAIYAGGSTYSLVFTFPECTIPAKGFLLVGALDFCDLQSEVSFQNGGSATDGVKLIDADGICIDVLLYDSPNENGLQVENGEVGTKFALDVSAGNSLARKIDGQDSDDCQEDFRECGKPTPGQSNVEKVYPLKISEIYYNPPGADGDQEWIELYNPTEITVDMTGWQILVAGSSFSLGYEFGAYLFPGKSFLVVGASEFCDIQESISCQNGGSATDGVVLCSPDLSYSDRVFYDQPNENLLEDESGAVASSFASNVSEGQSLARVNLSEDLDRSLEDFLPTDFLTPGFENKFPISLKLESFQKKGTELSTTIHNLSTFDLQANVAKIFLSYEGKIVSEQSVGFIPANGEIDVTFQVESQEKFYQIWDVKLESEMDANSEDNYLALSIVSSQGVLVINEVMCNPESGSSEWLEFYNSGDENIKIDNLQIRDKSGDVSRLSLDLQKGDYLVITCDLQSFAQTYPQVDLQKVIELKDLVSLNNSDEVLILEDSLGSCFDSVSYGNVDVPKGVSLEKFGYEDLGYVWGQCIEGATPAQANSVRAYRYAEKFQAEISAKVCEKNLPITISYVIPELRATVRVHCRVYDMYGNLCRNLCNYSRSATSGQIIFDGNDDRGDFLEVGVYFLELRFSRGNNMYSKKWNITVK